MDISLIIKVAGVGILISILNMLLEKTDRKDWATFTTLAGVIIVLSMVLTEISALFTTVKTMFPLRPALVRPYLIMHIESFDSLIRCG